MCLLFAEVLALLIGQHKANSSKMSSVAPCWPCFWPLICLKHNWLKVNQMLMHNLMAWLQGHFPPAWLKKVVRAVYIINQPTMAAPHQHLHINCLRTHSTPKVLAVQIKSPRPLNHKMKGKPWWSCLLMKTAASPDYKSTGCARRTPLSGVSNQKCSTGWRVNWARHC